MPDIYEQDKFMYLLSASILRQLLAAGSIASEEFDEIDRLNCLSFNQPLVDSTADTNT